MLLKNFIQKLIFSYALYHGKLCYSECNTQKYTPPHYHVMMMY